MSSRILVVRNFPHRIGMRTGRLFDVMWLVDQRERLAIRSRGWIGHSES